jgi:hypothetical protein
MSKAKYVPILKWKGGERIALRNLTDDIKKLIRPVLLVTRNTEPDSFCMEVARNWGTNREFYLDFHPDFAGNHAEFIEIVMNEEESKQLAIIPVVTMNTSLDFISFIENNISSSRFRHGLALRVRSLNSKTIQDWSDSLDQLINKADNIDLILDTGEIGHLPNDSIEMYSNLIKGVIRDLQQQNNFRHVIVAGASFPESISVRQNDISSISRIEWLLWKNIMNEMPYILFGDYGVDDPKDPEYEGRVTIIPTIRYTHEDHWYIIRGRYDPRTPYDYTQFHELSRMLLQRNHIFCGEEFSWGDTKIFECANTTCTITNCNHGNMTTWVQINTNHHLTYVALQVIQTVVS